MRRMVRLLAVAILLSGTGRALATPVEPPCANCGDESTLSPDEITISATVSEPFTVTTDDALLTLHRVTGSGPVGSAILPISGPALANPRLRDQATASFTIGGTENETIYIDIVGTPQIYRVDNGIGSSSDNSRIDLDLAWSGQRISKLGTTDSDGTFPATVTLGDDNGDRPDGRGAFRLWVGGSTRAVPAPMAAYQGKARIKMYYLE